MCHPCLLGEEYLPSVAPAKWPDKGEELRMPQESAAYFAKLDSKAIKKDLTPSTTPHHDDLLSRHRLSYLNGGGGRGKTTRAIELFRQRDHLIFSPTHRLAKEMQVRASRPRPIAASSAGEVRQSGHPEGWGRNSFPV